MYCLSFTLLFCCVGLDPAASHLCVVQLETDQALLQYKATSSIEKYGQQLVVANLLQTRKDYVLLVSASDRQEIRRESDTDEIEAQIIAAIAERHERHAATAAATSTAVAGTAQS